MIRRRYFCPKFREFDRVTSFFSVKIQGVRTLKFRVQNTEYKLWWGSPLTAIFCWSSLISYIEGWPLPETTKNRCGHQARKDRNSFPYTNPQKFGTPINMRYVVSHFHVGHYQKSQQWPWTLNPPNEPTGEILPFRDILGHLSKRVIFKARGVEVQQHQIWPFSTKTHHFDLFWPIFRL